MKALKWALKEGWKLTIRRAANGNTWHTEYWHDLRLGKETISWFAGNFGDAAYAECDEMGQPSKNGYKYLDGIQKDIPLAKEIPEIFIDGLLISTSKHNKESIRITVGRYLREVRS